LTDSEVLKRTYGTGKKCAGTGIAVEPGSAKAFEYALIKTDIDERRKVPIMKYGGKDLPCSSLHRFLRRNHPIPMQESQRKRPLAEISEISSILIPATSSRRKTATRMKAINLIFNL
jgi:hypothetical protein